jgi:hypothetical protein
MLGLLVLVLRTERSDMFGDKVVLFEEALDARCWNCTDGKPVPDTVLVESDLTGYGLFLERGPNTHMLEILSIKLLLLGLYDDPPVRVLVKAVLD